MRKYYIAAIVLLLLAVLWPKAKPIVTPTPDVIADVLDPSLDQYGPLWEAEVGRRFHNSVLVMCHGGDFLQNGEWICAPYGGPGGCWTIEHLIAHTQEEYPGRTIVILSCNPHHDILHGHPNVYYAMSSVWCVPDRAMIDNDVPKEERITLDGRSDVEPDDVGSIFEFVSAE